MIIAVSWTFDIIPSVKASEFCALCYLIIVRIFVAAVDRIVAAVDRTESTMK